MTGVSKLPITGLILTNHQHQDNRGNTRGLEVGSCCWNEEGPYEEAVKMQETRKRQKVSDVCIPGRTEVMTYSILEETGVHNTKR